MSDIQQNAPSDREDDREYYQSSTEEDLERGQQNGTIQNLNPVPKITIIGPVLAIIGCIILLLIFGLRLGDLWIPTVYLCILAIVIVSIIYIIFLLVGKLENNTWIIVYSLWSSSTCSIFIGFNVSNYKNVTIMTTFSGIYTAVGSIAILGVLAIFAKIGSDSKAINRKKFVKWITFFSIFTAFTGTLIAVSVRFEKTSQFPDTDISKTVGSEVDMNLVPKILDNCLKGEFPIFHWDPPLPETLDINFPGNLHGAFPCINKTTLYSLTIECPLYNEKLGQNLELEPLHNNTNFCFIDDFTTIHYSSDQKLMEWNISSYIDIFIIVIANLLIWGCLVDQGINDIAT